MKNPALHLLIAVTAVLLLASAVQPVHAGLVYPAGFADLNGNMARLSGAVPEGNSGNGTGDVLIDEILSGNQYFRKTGFGADMVRYQELAASQDPGILWIGCSDSRIDPERVTNAGPGEIFVTRNVGNIVPGHDWGMASVVEYSINYLNVKEIVIVGHSECGAMSALDKDLHDPYIPLWLNDAREAKTRVDSRIPAPVTPEEARERSRLIEQENVRLQMEHLMTYPSVAEAVAEGRVGVHGLYYNVSDGTLSVIA